jgi:hypothetical protein
MECADSSARVRKIACRVVGAAAAVGGVLFLALPGPAPAAQKDHALTFSGSCQLSGSVRFKPALTNSPQDGQVYGALRGQCSGTLTGASGHARSLNDRAVKVRGGSHGLESCEAGRGTGAGYVAFGHRRLRFTYKEVRGGPALILKADGAKGGSAVAQGNVSPSADPLAITRACGGAGLRRAPVDVRLATSPAISG